MPRKQRNFAPGVAYHVTQRGNDGRDVFHSDVDRHTYLDLLRRFSSACSVDIYAYCLMTNHVHLVVRPDETNRLSALMHRVQGRYSIYHNAVTGRGGHLWQARFYACGMDDAHLWNAVRYVERNPVRAGLCPRPEDHPWSSVRAHLAGLRPGDWLDYDFWTMAGKSEGWRELLEHPEDEMERAHLRFCTLTGRKFSLGDAAPQRLSVAAAKG